MDKVTRTTVNYVTFVPILAGRSGDFFGLFNVDGVDMVLRTDPNDASTEIPLRGGAQQGVIVPLRHPSKVPRYALGTVIYYAKQAVNSPATSVVVLVMP